jgi:hypothetical protein
VEKMRRLLDRLRAAGGCRAGAGGVRLRGSGRHFAGYTKLFLKFHAFSSCKNACRDV